MQKIWTALAGGALASLIGAAGVDAAVTDGTPVYVWALWALFVAIAVGFIVFTVVYGTVLLRRYLSAVDITDGLRCTYWPKQDRLQVVAWFRDRTDAEEYRLHCNAVIQGTKYALQIDNVGGTYLARRGFVSGKSREGIMMEFIGRDIVLDGSVETADVSVSVKPIGWLRGQTAQHAATVSVAIVPS